MYKVLLTGALLCLSPMVFAQQEVAAVSEEETQTFLAKDRIQKQSHLMDLLSVKKYDETRYLLAEWERTAPEGQGPNSFLKSYINDLIKEAEAKQ